MVIFRILGVCLAVWILSLSWSTFLDNRAFKKYGQRAYVEPVKEYTVTTTTFKSKKTGETTSEYKKNSVEAYFTTADNERVKIARAIPQAVVEQLIAGETVQLTYLPDRPQKVRFDGEVGRPGLGTLTAAVLLFVSIRVRRRE